MVGEIIFYQSDDGKIRLEMRLENETLWLTQQQMAERLGVSQAQVSRIEKRGYDAYTLNTLRRYISALGEGFARPPTRWSRRSVSPRCARL